MSEPSSKKQRTHPQYELLYHPGMPGRGEFIRLVFEAAGVSYTDMANETKDGYSQCQPAWDAQATSIDGNPICFAPPILRIPGAGPDSKQPLVISQTANILAYLGDKVGLVPAADEPARYHVAAVAMTALDLNNEVHDSHHPVAVMLYYEDQKDEALRKTVDMRENRLPKYFSYFTRLLKANEKKGGQGKYFMGDALTYADTTVWQVLDGLYYAFPKEMQARKEEFSGLLDKFYESVKEQNGIKEYLASDRRLKYSMGIFRHYPELDRQ